MRVINRFHRFHEGTPVERGVKVLGSTAVGSLLLIAATATLSAPAPEESAALAFADHPCAGIRADGATRSITWTTSVPTDANWVVVRTGMDTPRGVRATDGTVHSAVLPTTASDPRARIQAFSRRTTTAETVQSGDCAETVAADTVPTITALEIVKLASDHAIVEVRTDVPTTANARLVEPNTPWERTNTDPATVHRFTVDHLNPDTPYALRVHVRAVGSDAEMTRVVRWTTPRNGAEDTEPPTIAVLLCTTTELGITPSFVVPEPNAVGLVAYGVGSPTTKVEALRREATPVSVFSQTIPVPDDGGPFVIRATAIDAAGNHTVSDVIACAGGNNHDED